MAKNTTTKVETMKAWRAQFGLPTPEKAPQESENTVLNLSTPSLKKWGSKR